MGATDAEVAAGGYALPADLDLIGNGAQEIRQNARVAYENQWRKGAIPATVTTMNALVTPGVYQITQADADRLKDTPRLPGAGSVEVIANGSTGITQRYQMNNGFNQPRVIQRAGSTNGVFPGPWVSVTDLPEPITTAEKLQTITTPGTYSASTAPISKSIPDIPAEVSGIPFTLEVQTTWTSATAYRTVQVLTTLPFAASTPPRQWKRNLTQDGINTDWREDLFSARQNVEFPAGHRAEMLQQASRLRRGGRIGTNGATPVALTFDHGFANFRDYVLPHLKRLGLPSTVAVNTNTLGAGESLGVSYPQLQEWCLSAGVELSHHGKDHGDVTFGNVGLMADKLLGTVPLISAGCPECVADSFIMPGASGTFYTGFNGGVPYTNWWEHAAGRMLLDNFPVVTGLLPGQAVPVTGTPVQSVSRLGWDSPSWASAHQTTIKSLAGSGRGVVLYMHPSKIEAGITAAAVQDMLEWLAAERDAGRIEVLTLSGFAWADYHSAWRLNLAPESSWSADSVTIPMTPLNDALRGGQFTVTGAGSGTITATSDAGGLNTSATGNRLCFSIPVSATSVTVTAPGLTNRSITPA